MYILGLNVFHADTSACILKDGKIIAAFEEERFVNIKHFSEFPVNAVKNCLKISNISLSDVDFITINSNPSYNLFRKFIFFLKNIFKIKFINVLKKKNFKKKNIYKIFSKNFEKPFLGKMIFVPHHISHVASSFYISGFDNALGFSIDGSGDFSTAECYKIKNNKFSLILKSTFPNSLGIFYQAITQYLGFNKYGDEYKVMGLAAYGKPFFYNVFKKILYLKKNKIHLNLDYFTHHFFNDLYYNENGNIIFKNLFSKKLVKLFRRLQRKESEEVETFHQNVASSCQKIFEDISISMISNIIEKNPNYNNICLSGGCCLNSVMLGKLKKKFSKKNFFISPNPGDAGGALGSALYFYNQNIKKYKIKSFSPYLGRDFSVKEVIQELEKNKYSDFLEYEQYDQISNLINKIAILLNDQKVVAWFQGKMEWGPRALGNRSILASPREEIMKDIVNIKIKNRESFRPFAPAVLDDEASNYFDVHENMQFMNYVVNCKDKTSKIAPAIVHFNNTARPQIVKKEDNKIFYDLIKKFYEKSNIPILLNTSLNINGPICESPKDAISIFLQTNLDYLVINNFLISKKK